MNIPSSPLLASLLEKLVTAVGGVFTDVAIENGYVTIPLLVTISLVVAMPLLNKIRQSIYWRPSPLLSRCLKFTSIVGSICLFFLFSVYIVWGKSVTVDVTSTTGESRRSIVAVITHHGTDRLGTADIHHTDDQGVLQTWLLPGTHHYLLIKPENGQLYSSLAIRHKSFCPLQVSFKPPFNCTPLVQAILDRFIFDHEDLPESGDSFYDALDKTTKNPDQWYLVLGHTDTVGDSDYNQALGLRRAKAAADYLESRGVRRDHIIIGSGGHNFPADRSGMEQGHYGTGEPLDRRVEILCIPNPYGNSSKTQR